MDYFNQFIGGGITEVERKTVTSSPKDRLLNAVNDQIAISNGKTIEVAGNEKSSWRDSNGKTTIKVTEITLRTMQIDKKSDYDNLLNQMKSDIESGKADSLIEFYTGKLDEKKEKASKRKRRNVLIEMRKSGGLTDDQNKELTKLIVEVGDKPEPKPKKK